jgi:hypothetical protein
MAFGLFFTDPPKKKKKKKTKTKTKRMESYQMALSYSPVKRREEEKRQAEN